jgi:hypothetical protein
VCVLKVVSEVILMNPRRKLRSQTPTQLMVLFLAPCIFSFAACDSPTLRQPISGLVTVDGQSVDQGSITFLPDRGHRGPAASSAITAGNYRFTTENGPTPGDHRVIVGIETNPNAADSVASTTPSPSSPEASSVAKLGPLDSVTSKTNNREPNPLPPRPTQWEKAIKVPAANSPESGKTIDFKL